MLKWYQQENEYSDIIISSRVRLARNLKKYQFASRISDQKAEELINEVKTELGDYMENNEKLLFYYLPQISEVDKQAMVERHMISPLLAEKKQSTAFLLTKDESAGIMINEEDHIRIQVLAGGMDIGSALKRANRFDDISYEKLGFAFDEKYGYLTSCPTNTGTGLRASYMVFLPALAATGKISRLADEVSKYGVTLRGMYGEGSESCGSIFQISNQKTLGSNEEEIIDNLNNIVFQVIKQERKRREYILTRSYDEVEDQVYRSYGVLKYTKKINTKDAMTLLSQIKLGIDAGMLKIEGSLPVYEMMMRIQPASLQYNAGKNVGSVNRDKLRGEYINRNLPDLVG